jgi:transcription initiation factor TFIIB
MESKIEVKSFSSSCPECGGKTIPIQEKGEIVCGQCGLVVNERILDTSHSGKRAFTKQEKQKKRDYGITYFYIIT